MELLSFLDQSRTHLFFDAIVDVNEIKVSLPSVKTRDKTDSWCEYTLSYQPVVDVLSVEVVSRLGAEKGLPELS